MAIFFPQAGGDLFTGSTAYLDSIKNNFKTDQATGIIEIQPSPGNDLCILFAEGVLVGAYRRAGDGWIPIREHETVLGWSAEQVPLRLLTLSDIAGRSVWLALESQPGRRLQINNAEEWQEILAECRQAHFTGQIQAVSATCTGLFVCWNGLLVTTEAVFCTPKGFEFTPSRFSCSNVEPLQVTLANFDMSKPSWKSCALRLSAANWSKRLLECYCQLAGQRLLQTLSDEVNIAIRNQRWKIRFDGNNLLDYHFFPQDAHVHQAYLMIFNNMCERMQTVLGKLLEARIFNETFEALDSLDRNLLEATNLTPAALSVK